MTTTSSTTITGPIYNNTGAYTYTGNTAVTSISAQMTFNTVTAVGADGTSQAFNMINASLTDGTNVYIGLHEPGSAINNSGAAPGGTADVAVFGNESSTATVNPLNGSSIASFVDGGSPSVRALYTGVNLVPGATYTVKMAFDATGALDAYVIDSSGHATEFASITGLKANTFAIGPLLNNPHTIISVFPGHEITANGVPTSQEASDDVVVSNIEYNGSTSGVSDTKTVGEATWFSEQNTSNSAHASLVTSGTDPADTQATREMGANYMETASGAGINTVHLAGTNMTIIGGNSNSELQVNATNHDLTTDILSGPLILDLNGQNTTMSVAQYQSFASVVDSAGGGGVTLTLGSGVTTLNMNDTTVANFNVTTPDGDALVASFKGASSQYTITSDSTGVTVTGHVGSVNSVDHFSQVTELQFTDGTEFVASTTPPTGGLLSSANVAELYSAVLAREPDALGLAYYEQQAVANPTTGFLTYAEYFLSAPEYVNNTAHNYAQNATGDGQFVTDSYNNLLHRGPASGDVQWYLTNVINPIIAADTASGSTLAQAELHAHAQMLVYFSQSQEFLNDVSVTGSNPVSAQHWLHLV